MALDVAPQTQNRLHKYAEDHGISADEAINRLLRTVESPRPVLESDPVLQFLSEQLREAEGATLQEEADAEADWIAFQQNMNENRQINGERLLYTAVAPQ